MPPEVVGEVDVGDALLFQQLAAGLRPHHVIGLIQRGKLSKAPGRVAKRFWSGKKKAAPERAAFVVSCARKQSVEGYFFTIAFCPAPVAGASMMVL